ncbi:hypothetical protein ACFO3O_10940 [Dokdonia ponticola]|uniref:Transposase n=1 Tax=Dokdonia ponticola TaxID=2041041 RepID=A0ABV9HXF4_9FLAO
MSRNYKFHNPEGLYFVSFAVVNWLDVFTRNQYKDILIDSLSFCQKESSAVDYAGEEGLLNDVIVFRMYF